jgi:hypothetical protein
MPSGSATVTSKIGPAVTATALAFSNIRAINFDTLRAVVSVTLSDGRVVDFDANATATITATAASGVFTFVVNQ